MKRNFVVIATLVILALLISAGCTQPAPKPAENTDSTAQVQTPPETTETPAEVPPATEVPGETATPLFTSPDGSFSVEVPEGFQQTVSGDMVHFTDNTSTIMVKWIANATEPTFAKVKEVEVKELEKANPGFKLGNVEEKMLPAGPAIVISYEFDGKPAPGATTPTRSSVMIFKMFKAGTGVDITVESPVAAGYEEKWKTFTESFKWLK